MSPPAIPGIPSAGIRYKQDSINLLSLKVSVCEIACVGGDVSLCTPANDTVRIHITWRICAKSFRCLEVSATSRLLYFSQEEKHHRYPFAG